ncbi:MAG: MBL fold metallo-hydrolase [Actinomycetota bacterium]|jgi:glyoxylase-like metal-dependent hydrolase (beta-lactamase superfamily II)|nr:MBL fold metallo-hydrolase [Rubrobacter sp.]MDQ3508214.1 MBL fold metallo-hydrolase [Actinomycetota bacterium]
MTGSNLTKITAPNPGPLTLSGTNTYVFGGVAIDPGPDDEAHLSEVAAASAIETILLTHRHPDHASGATRLAEMTGVSVLAFGDGIADGDEFSGLVAVHTPGHAPDHVCFFHEGSGTLFSGDLIAGEGSIMVAPPEGDLADYMESLRRVRNLSPSRILPGHGPEVADAGAKIEEYVSHREEREAMVIKALESGAETVEEVVALAYSEVPPEMRPYAGRAARAHLEKLGRSLP